jgi:hypothetical protein
MQAGLCRKTQREVEYRMMTERTHAIAGDEAAWCRVVPRL